MIESSLPPPFRKFIVVFLSRTVYARRALSDERIEEVAKDLGVLPETLMEARLIYRERAARMGLKVSNWGAFRGGQKYYSSLCMRMPPPSKAAVVEYVKKTREVSAGCFIRSMVHKYLQGSWEPEFLYDRWNFPMKGKRAVINVSVSEAARTGIWMRAEMLKSNAEELLRTLVQESMLGRFAQPGTIQYVTKAQMFTDVEDYQVRFPEDRVTIPRRLDFGT